MKTLTLVVIILHTAIQSVAGQSLDKLVEKESLRYLNLTERVTSKHQVFNVQTHRDTIRIRFFVKPKGRVNVRQIESSQATTLGIGRVILNAFRNFKFPKNTIEKGGDTLHLSLTVTYELVNPNYSTPRQLQKLSAPTIDNNLPKANFYMHEMEKQPMNKDKYFLVSHVSTGVWAYPGMQFSKGETQYLYMIYVRPIL